MTPKEREIFARLRGMVSNMLMPEHDQFQGHNRHTCRMCRTMEAADAILGA